jgi:hypothetical protein
MAKMLEGYSQSSLNLPKEEIRKFLPYNFEFIRRQCSFQTKSKKELSAEDPMISTQAVLARLAANKRAAHMTLDDFGITDSDLRDLVFQASLIARAIQQCFGENACDSNYKEIDKASYEESIEMFGVKHSRGLLLKFLDENLEMRRSRMTIEK